MKNNFLSKNICWWLSDKSLKEFEEKIEKGDKLARKQWIEWTLSYGKLEDILKLNFDEVRKIFKELNLPDKKIEFLKWFFRVKE